jgi:diketogulonate reductase-like aldo/keto reductase
MKFDTATNTLLKSLHKPPFIYGTAWKKENTTTLVRSALDAGFRGIDTAAQPKHYREDLVGEALRDVYEYGSIKREDLFIQTKFTSSAGQDLRDMPYNPESPLAEQISMSLKSSLTNLRPRADPASAADAYIDCLLLHSPLATDELTLQAWRILEAFVPRQIHAVGLSNCPLSTLEYIYSRATVKPAAVQNRFYSRTGYDGALRAFCEGKGIVYQSFWTLTGNKSTLLVSDAVRNLAREAGVSPEVALYALVIELGIAPLNGTTSEERMVGDLRDLQSLKNWQFVYADKWKSSVDGFKELVQQK